MVAGCHSISDLDVPPRAGRTSPKPIAPARSQPPRRSRPRSREGRVAEQVGQNHFHDGVAGGVVVGQSCGLGLELGQGNTGFEKGVGIGHRGQLVPGRHDQPLGVAFVYLALGSIDRRIRKAFPQGRELFRANGQSSTVN